MQCRSNRWKREGKSGIQQFFGYNFLSTSERIGSFAWQGRSIYHWLRQVALNKTIDYHRAAGRRIGSRRPMCSPTATPGLAL